MIEFHELGLPQIFSIWYIFTQYQIYATCQENNDINKKYFYFPPLTFHFFSTTLVGVTKRTDKHSASTPITERVGDASGPAKTGLSLDRCVRELRTDWVRDPSGAATNRTRVAASAEGRGREGEAHGEVTVVFPLRLVRAHGVPS